MGVGADFCKKGEWGKGCPGPLPCNHHCRSQFLLTTVNIMFVTLLKTHLLKWRPKIDQRVSFLLPVKTKCQFLHFYTFNSFKIVM